MKPINIVPLEMLNDVNELRGLVGFLYDLLDDTDTADDLAKSNDKKYREMVFKIQAKRLVRVASDGYKIYVNLKPEIGVVGWEPRTSGSLSKPQNLA